MCVCAEVLGCLWVCVWDSQNTYWRIESLNQRTLIRILYEFFIIVAQNKGIRDSQSLLCSWPHIYLPKCTTTTTTRFYYSIIRNGAKRRKACIKKHFQKSTISKYEMNEGENFYIPLSSKNSKIENKIWIRKFSFSMSI